MAGSLLGEDATVNDYERLEERVNYAEARCIELEERIPELIKKHLQISLNVSPERVTVRLKWNGEEIDYDTDSMPECE